MYAVVGTLSVAVAAFIFVTMLLATRKPNPSKWTTSTLTHEVFVMVPLALGSFGIACIWQSIGSFSREPLTAIDIISIVSILIIFVTVWSRLRVRATLARYAEQARGAAQASRSGSTPGFVPEIVGAAAGTEATPPEDPSSPTRPRTPHVPKKAA